MPSPLYLGIDVGTSGVRTSVIDNTAQQVASCAVSLPAPLQVDGRVQQDAQLWLHAVTRCLQQTSKRADFSQLAAIAVDATSATVLLTLADGTPLTAAMMYNDTSAQQQAQRIAALAPVDSAAHGASSSLAKLLAFNDSYPGLAAKQLCHQADYISSWLSGKWGMSDENNCLKLGYDAVKREWPQWLQQLDVDMAVLPQVVSPGAVTGQITAQHAQAFGIDSGCNIVAGTTDSIAAFIATGASAAGDAVTSLGSTLVIKQVSTTPVYSPAHGIYSHRYYADDSLWLVGGASNTGCGVLRELFSQQQLDDMTAQLQPQQATGLTYYPLPQAARGERFPVADPNKLPVLQPRPDDDVMYFQGLLESIADIERNAYQLLEQLGAGKAKRVLTAGGGSRNQPWNSIRQQRLQLPVTTADHTEASYGAALLARSSQL